MLDENSRKIYQENITNFIDQKFKRINALPREQKDLILEQLEWVQENKQFTPQADVIYNPSNPWIIHLNREIARALSRIECLLLLREVNEENKENCYGEFVSDQNADERLSPESFNELVGHFQQLTDAEVDVQLRASLIAAVTLSPEAKRLADDQPFEKYPYDSVQFSGFTVTYYGDIYAAYKTATEEVKRWLEDCFRNDNRHWRHAFFMENKECLDSLINDLKNCPEDEKMILQSKIRQWLNYWLINALGFNGHLKTHMGSEFMTESVYQRAKMLNEAIFQLIDNPALDVFQTYSQKCLDLLGLEIHQPETRLFIVRLLNMANLFNVETGKEVQQYLRDERLFEKINEASKVFNSGKVATYVPGFLMNIASLPFEQKIANVVSAFVWVNEVLENSPAFITSFINVKKDECKSLVENDFQHHVTINDKGEVQVGEPPQLRLVA